MSNYDTVPMLPGFESVPAVPKSGRFSVGKAYRQARVRRAGRKWRKRRGLDPRRVLAVAMEREVQNRLADLGYVVTGTSHKAHFDLLVCGVRVEVKASVWSGARYGAALRDSDADVLVLGCLGADLRFFVIPFDQVRGLSYLKITSRDPANYKGRFAPFLGAWGVIEQAVQSGVNAWQMSLFEGVQC